LWRKLWEVHNVRVGAGVGHGEHVRLVVLQLEVLIGELLSVDGTTTRTLEADVSIQGSSQLTRVAYVMTGKVSALEHELGDDTVEGAASIAAGLVALAEFAEVLGGLGDGLVEELEVEASLAF
jgi:hypothetical protein